MYTVSTKGKDEVIGFAAEEFKKYLFSVTGEEVISGEGGFTLALMGEVGLDTSDVEDPSLDDIIYIDTTERGGIIAGSNPHSVLIAVYEYLRRLGCVWLFPGRTGEFIPRGRTKPVKYRNAPKFRTRGPCIEGTVTQRIVLDMIEWLPKVGMNTFMSQCIQPTVFYQRNYSTLDAGTMRAKDNSREAVAAYKREFTRECARRGLVFHDIGHGWTVLPFGIFADAWHPEPPPVLAPENEIYMAELDGKRELRGALNTQACMSNEKGRGKILDYIVNYAEEHPEVDVLHVWLADGSNNQCECEKCREKTASDWYVIFLNELDRRLSERNIDTRICFAVYTATVYPPERERLNNHERFILDFAPITRRYTVGLEGTPVRTQKYELNKMPSVETLDEYFAYYRLWRESFGGDSLAYEYHFWRFACLDISGLDIAERVFEDIGLYSEMEINGIISCGTLRPFFRGGFAYYLFARAMFDSRASYGDILEEYFSLAYGDKWESIYAHLRKIQSAFDYKYMLAENSANPEISLYYNPGRAEILRGMRDITDALRADIALAESTHSNEVERTSLFLLRNLADYADMVADFIIPMAEGDPAAARVKYDEFVAEMQKREEALTPYFDHWLNVAYLERIIRTKDKFW